MPLRSVVKVAQTWHWRGSKQETDDNKHTRSICRRNNYRPNRNKDGRETRARTQTHKHAHTARTAGVLRIKKDRLYTLKLKHPPLHPHHRLHSAVPNRDPQKRYSSQRCWVTGRKGEKRLKEKDGVAPSKGRDSVSLLLPAAWQLKLRGRSSSPSASF